MNSCRGDVVYELLLPPGVDSIQVAGDGLRTPMKSTAKTVDEYVNLMNVYGDWKTEQWFRKAWEGAGKKLDMGKACVRFKRLEDVPLEVVGQVIARTPVADYIARIESYFASKGGKSKAEKRKRQVHCRPSKPHRLKTAKEA